MSPNSAEAPSELAKLRNFGSATARATRLPQPPPRPAPPAVAAPAASEAEEWAASEPTGQPDAAATPAPVQPAAPAKPAPPPLPDDLLTRFLESPRSAVISTEVHRKASAKRQLGTYLGEDTLRTLAYLAYVDGCETWKWLDSAVRAIAQAREVEVRPYTDEEIGRR